MERLLYGKLVEWKTSAARKPLILEGARQVGKTWLLKQFGKREFANLVYINCDGNEQAQLLFTDFNIERILRGISAISGQNISAGKTLIVLDEIQEIPRALTSLKYFCENAPEYHIAAAGSLLGIGIHSGTGFPVGKVDMLKLFPLSFPEFLRAMEKDILTDYLQSGKWSELNLLAPQIVELLRQYYFTGGMPEVVMSYIKEKNLQKVRRIQHSILHGYENDISKHAPGREIPKISLVWHSIPSQLAKENKKFIYGAVKQGGRAKEFENAIQWLINAGLVYKVNRVKRLDVPLKYYEDFDAFKLYVNDLGLLGAMADAPVSEILVGKNAFSNYKGSFTEQYIAQQYFSLGSDQLFYYTNENSTVEIDFVIQTDKVYPVEVKAKENLKSKSLSSILRKNEKLHGIRFSMSGYREQEQMINVPLFLAANYLQALSQHQ